MLKFHFTSRNFTHRTWVVANCALSEVGGQSVPCITTMVFNMNGDFVGLNRAALEPPCGKHFRGVLLLVSWDCSLYGKGPQNNQHQAQAQLRIHSFLYCNRKTNGQHSLDLILVDLAQITFSKFCT